MFYQQDWPQIGLRPAAKLAGLGRAGRFVACCLNLVATRDWMASPSGFEPLLSP